MDAADEGTPEREALWQQLKKLIDTDPDAEHFAMEYRALLVGIVEP
jgi:hypothetical protein